MCHFVTGTLPTTPVPEAAQEIAASCRLQFAPIANGFVQRQLRPGEGYFQLGRGMCDCGTPLGSRRRVSPEDRREAIKVAALRNKGWSDAKIERWIEQQRANGRKRDRLLQTQVEAERTLLDTWVSFVQELLAEGEVDSFGLLLHWYKGGLESERIEIRSRHVFPVSEVSTDLLFEINEDELYEFRRAGWKGSANPQA